MSLRVPVTRSTQQNLTQTLEDLKHTVRLILGAEPSLCTATAIVALTLVSFTNEQLQTDGIKKASIIA